MCGIMSEQEPCSNRAPRSQDNALSSHLCLVTCRVRGQTKMDKLVGLNYVCPTDIFPLLGVGIYLSHRKRASALNDII